MMTQLSQGKSHEGKSHDDRSRALLARTRAAGAGGGGSIGFVLLIALLLCAATVGLIVIGRAHAEPYIFALLAVLATVGVFVIFALAAGLLRGPARDRATPLLKAVLDGADDATLVTDAGGRVLYANAAYRKLMASISGGELRSVERAFVGDASVSEAIYRLLKAARAGRRAGEEVRIAARKGEAERCLRISVRPLAAGKSEAGVAVWSLAQSAGGAASNASVAHELHHVADYLDHAPAGFFSADADGRVAYLNATLANWIEHDHAHAGDGLTLDDIVAGEGAALLTTLSGEPGEVKTEIRDIDLKTRSGRTLPARLYHRVAFGPDGAPGASRTLVLNRARNAGEDPQRAAEVRFMRFFQNTPMAIATVDRHGRIADSNARFARLFHPALKGETERSILTVIAERDRIALEAAIRRAADGQGEIAPVEAALAGGAGPGERFAQFFVTPIEDGEQREREAAIVYALDTTQQRILENQLNQQQKMETIGRLAGNIAHDFNNLLSAIMMATDFLLNAHKPTDPSFQDIMQIKQNANRAASLVRQLLAFSRKQTLRPQVIDLGEALSDLSVLLRRLIGANVTLDVPQVRELWPVKADVGQFEQVIINLAVNARDAMSDGGKLTLRTANVEAGDAVLRRYRGMPLGEYVLVEIEDTGSGIAPEIINKIFDPFYTTKEVGKGTGLGLSTVYGIVKQTGGFIFVDSQVGRSTTFRIFLPRHVPAADDIEPPQLPETTAPAMAMSAADEIRRAAAADLTGQGTILLVEDEEGLRALNARGLASRGYTVIEAGNGAEALAELDRQGGRVDLVVSDVVMPEMDGPTLLKELRRRSPDVKIIFVSGYAEDAFEKNLSDANEFEFLSKPFTLKQLVTKVKEAMAA